MTANVGTIDRFVRAMLGMALIAASLAGFIGAWGWVGAVPLLTAAFRFCPLYTALGINTCKVARS